MKKILILFAHPGYHRSHANKALLQALRKVEGIHVHDLYQRYPNMFIDVAHEQQLLLEHDIIIFQHPLYWYSSPAIIKEWMDQVLEYGFAFGPDGHALKGKALLSVITTGGSQESYTSWHWRDRTGNFLHSLKIHIANQFLRRNAIDAHINDSCPRLHHIRSDEVWLADGSNQDVCLSGDFGKILRMRVTDRYGSILGQQQMQHRLANNIAATDDYSLPAIHGNLG